MINRALTIFFVFLLVGGAAAQSLTFGLQAFVPPPSEMFSGAPGDALLNAVDFHNRHSPNDQIDFHSVPTAWATAGSSGATVFLMAYSDKFAAYTHPTENTVYVSVLVLGLPEHILGHFVRHELFHQEFKVLFGDYTDWANDLDSCTDNECIQNKLNAQWCQEAYASSKSAASSCAMATAPPCPPPEEEPDCEDLTELEKEGLCALAEFDRLRCEALMGPGDGTEPVGVPQPGGGSRELPVPGGACSSAQVPPGIIKPTIVCPEPCDCDDGSGG